MDCNERVWLVVDVAETECVALGTCDRDFIFSPIPVAFWEETRFEGINMLVFAN
jgi:hypothetical protein